MMTIIMYSNRKGNTAFEGSFLPIKERDTIHNALRANELNGQARFLTLWLGLIWEGKMFFGYKIDWVLPEG